jgi:arginyl-tRNA synthetase
MAMSYNLYEDLHFRIKRDALDMWPEASGVSFTLQEPNHKDHGDYATNIAMVLSRALKKSPLDVAQEFVDHLKSKTWVKEYFRDVIVAKPGFVNFFMKSDYLLGLLQVYTEKLTSVENKKEKIVLEHTNVNPNKAMHIGHLRNAILGDTIKRVLQRSGFKTEVQYYVDDTGVQVADTFLGLQELNLKQNKDEKYDHFCWRVYTAINKEYEKNDALKEKRTLILHELEDRKSKTAAEVKKMVSAILLDHLASMWEYKIDYDLLVWESDVLAFGFWDAAFKKLQKSKSFVKEVSGKNVGCWVIKSGDSDADDEHSTDKVIVKSDNSITYTGKDIAYHMWKYDVLGKDFKYSPRSSAPQEKELYSTDEHGKKHDFGNADRVYNVIDERQAYPQTMVKFALEELGYADQAEALKHVSYGVVSLSADSAKNAGLKTDDTRDTYSMSGRKGIGVKADDVRDAVKRHVAAQVYVVKNDRNARAVSHHDVAIGAIKYFMLRYNPQTEIAFDYDEALSLEGNTGPYLMYAHARAAGILDKGEITSMPQFSPRDLTVNEQRLLVRLYRWPTIISAVTEDLQVNALANYAFELANTFNAFYEAVPVYKAKDEDKEHRYALVYAFKTVLADVLDMLGITAPDKM